MVVFYAYIRQIYQEKRTSEDIENTVSCKREGASLREAGNKYGVPRATLARYLQPKQKNGAQPHIGALGRIPACSL